MNILIKLMSIVSLVLAPTLAQVHKGNVESTAVMKEKRVEVTYSQEGEKPNDSTTFQIEIKKGSGEPVMQGLIEALKRDPAFKGENLSVSWKNGVLEINGAVQGPDVVSKYGEYLKEKETFNIKIETKE